MDDEVAPQAANQLPHYGSHASVESEAAEGHGGHSMWWMVACCAPMVLIAVALVLGAFGTR